MEYSIVLLFLILLGICIYYLYFSTNCNSIQSSENFSSNCNNNNQNNDDGDDDDYDVSVKKSCGVIKKVKIGRQNKKILSDIFDDQDFNPKPTPSQFNDDFFGFRNVTNNMASSFESNPIDKINCLRQKGDLNLLNNCEPVKIKDLYDNLMKPIDLYNNVNIRQPNIERLDRGIYSNLPFEVSANEWKYSNENALNGGILNCNKLVPSDPNGTSFQEI